MVYNSATAGLGSERLVKEKGGIMLKQNFMTFSNFSNPLHTLYKVFIKIIKKKKHLHTYEQYVQIHFLLHLLMFS